MQYICLLPLAAQDAYIANSYHNGTHAADVAYTVHAMLVAGAQTKLKLSSIQVIACVIAGAAHDVRHPVSANARRQCGQQSGPYSGVARISRMAFSFPGWDGGTWCD